MEIKDYFNIPVYATPEEKEELEQYIEEHQTVNGLKCRKGDVVYSILKRGMKK